MLTAHLVRSPPQWVPPLDHPPWHPLLPPPRVPTQLANGPPSPRPVHLALQRIQHLPRGIPISHRTVEKQRPSDRWVPQVTLDVSEVGGCHVVKDGLELVHVAFWDGDRDVGPGHRWREGKPDAVRYDDGDASKGHGFNQPWAPRGPP